MENRRRYMRYPSFSIINVKIKDAFNQEKIVHMTIRDESFNGFCAIYVGNEVDTHQAQFLLEDDQNWKLMKLVWHKNLEQNIYLFGFEILTDSITNS